MNMERTSQNIMFYERCRLCLDEKGYCDIFERNNLKEDIYDCLGLKIVLLDNLPQKICEKCLNIVNKVTELRKLALRNDKQLQLLVYHAEETENPVEVGNSQLYNIDSTQRHPAIQTFLSVRKDLFESSVPGDISDEDMTEMDETLVDSSQDSLISSNEAKNNEKIVYKCDVCKKIFDKRKKLYYHSRLHNKTFSCPVQQCEKKFATKGDLEKHIRIHTGEKPYKCDQCCKSFSQKVSLKGHLETVHAN